MSTIKPLDNDAVLCAAKASGLIVTAEEHSIIGGLGSSVRIPFRELSCAGKKNRH